MREELRGIPTFSYLPLQLIATCKTQHTTIDTPTVYRILDKKHFSRFPPTCPHPTPTGSSSRIA